MTSGLRERKKQATRAHISAVATRLFIAQGFESTTIAQIATEADVAKMTVTNYFPLKEDLFFDRAPEVVALLGEVVSRRPAGASPDEAVRDEFLELLAARSPMVGFGNRDFIDAIGASAALQARGRALVEEQEAALAATLAAEARTVDRDDDGLGARLEAARIAGVVRVLVTEVVRRTRAGEDDDAVAAAVRRAAERSLARRSPFG